MRTEFEKLPEIKDKLERHEHLFNYKTNQYECEDVCAEVFINGAWYAYQEQKKRIDAVLSLCKSKHQKVDYWVDHFIDDIEELLK